MDYKVPLILTSQAEGGHSDVPLAAGIGDGGRLCGEALDNVKDALAAVIELYEDLGRSLPDSKRRRCPR